MIAFASFLYFGFVRSVHNDNYMPESLAFDPATIGLKGSYTTGFPTIGSIGNATQGGFSTTYGMGVGAPVVNYQNKPTAVLSATNIRGNHTYKAGAQWRKDPAINKNSIAAPSFSFTGNETALPYLQSTNIGGASIGLPYASFLLGLGVRDATGGFRAYRFDLLRRIDPRTVHANGYGFQIEMVHRAIRLGATVVEVPITFTDRRLGTSKMSPQIVWEALGRVTWWGIRDLFQGGPRGNRNR